ncbi:hypothetical protein ACR6HW_04140 [Fusibacter sp. JL298sf-3]
MKKKYMIGLIAGVLLVVVGTIGMGFSNVSNRRYVPMRDSGYSRDFPDRDGGWGRCHDDWNNR